MNSKSNTKTMHRSKFHRAFVPLVTTCLLASGADAATIVSTTSFEIVATSGPDTVGLSGANFTLISNYDDTSPYINRFGFPAAPSLSQTVTVSSSSVGANNDTYTIPDGMAFYPTFAGIFSEPGGLADITLSLNFGGSVDFAINMGATPTGALATIGGPLLLSHFDGASLVTFIAGGSDGTTYDLVPNSGSQTAVIPEPSSALLLGIGALGFAASRRRNIF